MRVCVRAPLVPRHSWLGCAAWVCVLGFGFPLRPATPGWGVAVCVCWCARSACTPPLLAWVCGVGVCVWALVSAAPRHSWLGCWGVCVCLRAPLVPRHSWLGCAAWLCVLGHWFRLRPATPGWGIGVCVSWCVRSTCIPPLLAGVCRVGVCVWARVSAAPRHAWLGCCGMRICVRAPLVHRHSRLGCAAWVSVYGFGFRLRPAAPGWCVWVCVCWCARSPCTPPLLAGVCGVGLCVWARVSAAPRHSWLGLWGVYIWVRAPPVPRHSWLGCAVWVCVLGLEFRLRPATPGWGVGGCVCWCARSACTLPLLAGLCGVDVCVWTRISRAPRHSWLGPWGVRVCVRAPLVIHHSWLGCAAWVCFLGLGFRLRPATPGLGVGVCVCWCARSACLPPLLAGVSGVDVCLGSSFSCALPLLTGVLGCVCAGVRAPPLPCHTWLGCAAWVSV